MRDEGIAMKSAVSSAVKRALRITGAQKKEPILIPFLVRTWHEDGVWNVSAFDLPIVAFDEDFEQAQKYFYDAACSHFMTLRELGKIDKVAHELIRIAKTRGFYEQRIQTRQLVQRIDYSAEDHSLCAATG